MSHSFAVSASPRVSFASATSAYRILRVGAAGCFIGHGAFGFITKAAWLPYFAVIGIPEPWAWRLMPIVGAVDVMAAMAVLFAPRGLPLLYMAVWGLWTALLRPLSGESAFEAVERAGNYGVPLALLLWAGPWAWNGLMRRADTPTTDAPAMARVRLVLKWTTVLLLVGHGMLGAITGKALLAAHYAAIGLPPETLVVVGWFEIALGVTVAIRPMVGLLLLVAAWKVATESLFLVVGAPLWEFVERAGSYAAPLALAAMQHVQHRNREVVENTGRRLGAARPTGVAERPVRDNTIPPLCRKALS